jgi:hypothetical protein
LSTTRALKISLTQKKFKMLTEEQKQQFSEILEELGKSLDISESQYNAAVRSYTHVAEWLSAVDSPIAVYSPEILPQGSFLLQTMIKPIHENDELDIDLVCKLEKIKPGLTQFDLKHLVGDRLKANGIFAKLLKAPDGRRCWTLSYSESANFHLDVLPSVVATGYRTILEKAFSAGSMPDVENLGVRITDKESLIYKTSTNLLEWLKSNPFGYAIWFRERSRTAGMEIRMLSEAIQPVPKFQQDKLPLQRVVQILKRHRDLMFNGDEDKPISIIITTLAAKTYSGENNIIDALLKVVNGMSEHIIDRWDPVVGRYVKWVANPVNQSENFADKWIKHPIRQHNFYKWITDVQKDLQNILVQGGTGLQNISESMQKSFGKDSVTKALSNYGANLLMQRENGKMKMASGTGLLGSIGRTTVPQHKPFGSNE